MLTYRPGYRLNSQIKYWIMGLIYPLQFYNFDRHFQYLQWNCCNAWWLYKLRYTCRHQHWAWKSWIDASLTPIQPISCTSLQDNELLVSLVWVRAIYIVSIAALYTHTHTGLCSILSLRGGKENSCKGKSFFICTSKAACVLSIRNSYDLLIDSLLLWERREKHSVCKTQECPTNVLTLR